MSIFTFVNCQKLKHLFIYPTAFYLEFYFCNIFFLKKSIQICNVCGNYKISNNIYLLR